MHRLAGRHVDSRGARLVSDVQQDLCRGTSVVLTQIGKQHALPDTHPARDRLSNLSSSNDNNYVLHAFFSLTLARRSGLGDGPAETFKGDAVRVRSAAYV